MKTSCFTGWFHRFDHGSNDGFKNCFLKIAVPKFSKYIIRATKTILAKQMQRYSCFEKTSLVANAATKQLRKYQRTRNKQSEFLDRFRISTLQTVELYFCKTPLDGWLSLDDKTVWAEMQCYCHKVSRLIFSFSSIFFFTHLNWKSATFRNESPNGMASSVNLE